MEVNCILSRCAHSTSKTVFDCALIYLLILHAFRCPCKDPKRERTSPSSRRHASGLRPSGLQASSFSFRSCPSIPSLKASSTSITDHRPTTPPRFLHGRCCSHMCCLQRARSSTAQWHHRHQGAGASCDTCAAAVPPFSTLPQRENPPRSQRGMSTQFEAPVAHPHAPIPPPRFLRKLRRSCRYRSSPLLSSGAQERCDCACVTSPLAQVVLDSPMALA